MIKNVREEVNARIDAANTAQACRLPDDVATALANLFQFFGESLDGRAIAYARVLFGVSGPLLDATIARAIDESTFFPRPVELRGHLEECRKQLLAAHPHRPCAKCETSPGWLEVEDTHPETKDLKRLLTTPSGRLVLGKDGEPVLNPVPPTTRLQRCPCHAAWERRLGLPPAPPKPTVEIDEDKGIGQGASTWTSTRELAASKNVVRFKERLK